MSPQYADEDLESHYGAIAAHLFEAIETKKISNPLNERLELPARIARVLSLKCHLRQYLVDAYRSQDYERLYSLAETRLMPLRQEVDQLWRYHRNLWMKMYKPHGWEVLELRYGGLRTRLETMYDHVVAHVQCMLMRKEQMQGKSMDPEEDEEQANVHWRIPEFETDLECLYYGSRTNLLLDYNRVVSPSRPG